MSRAAHQALGSILEASEKRLGSLGSFRGWVGVKALASRTALEISKARENYGRAASYLGVAVGLLSFSLPVPSQRGQGGESLSGIAMPGTSVSNTSNVSPVPPQKRHFG
jgi:hypothetical protein